MNEKAPEFEIKWGIDDGYVGGNRPQYYTLEASDFEGMTEEGIEEEIYGIIEDEFSQKVSWYIENLEDAVEWAKQRNGN